MAARTSKELNDGNVDLQVYSDGYGAVAIAVPDASDSSIRTSLRFMVMAAATSLINNVNPADVYYDNEGTYEPLTPQMVTDAVRETDVGNTT